MGWVLLKGDVGICEDHVMSPTGVLLLGLSWLRCCRQMLGTLAEGPSCWESQEHGCVE